MNNNDNEIIIIMMKCNIIMKNIKINKMKNNENNKIINNNENNVIMK